jgi:membrane associated rhomboid family serine protease
MKIFALQAKTREYHPVSIASISMLIVMVMWITFYVDVKWDLDMYTFGVYPGEVRNLPGILMAPIIHGSLSHLLNNTIPVFILTAGILYFYPVPAFRIFILSWLLPGLFAWFIARPSYHIGASGFVYAMAAFVFMSGVIRVNRYLLALSLLIAFLYGSMFFGMFPLEEGISWESHLGGGLTGTLIAILYRKVQPSQQVIEDRTPDASEADEENDIYLQRIGDAWKQEPEYAQTPEDNPNASDDRVLKVIYHLKIENIKRDENS